MKYPNAAKDAQGRLRVGAAIGSGPTSGARAGAGPEKVDVLAIDTAHGHSQRVLEAAAAVKSKLPDADLIAGNVATYEGARDLIALGVDGIKVGIGPGSICTTRVVTGASVPQITAIGEGAARRAGRRSRDRRRRREVLGRRHQGHRRGRGLRHDWKPPGRNRRAPRETILYQGRTFKAYRGMGSLGAMASGLGRPLRQRSQRRALGARRASKGASYQRVREPIWCVPTGGWLRSGMGELPRLPRRFAELHQQAKFLRVTPAGLRESHVHDVIITKEAPNYRLE